jgi:regulator of protease activity HflC (stomatin/prohibitin superfamily)
VADNLPKSKEFWQIAPEIVQILDNVVMDMTADVEKGRVQELSLLAEEAGKKLVPMVAVGFFAMGKVMEAERREQRELERTEREARELAEAAAEDGEGRDEPPDEGAEGPTGDG